MKQNRTLIRKPSGAYEDIRADEQGRLLMAEGIAPVPHYLLDEWEVDFPANAAQYYGEEIVIPRPFSHSHSKYVVYVNNPSNVTTLNLSIRNGSTYPNAIQYGEIATKTVPVSTYTAMTATAWSSCFTSIGGVLSDESGDANDANAANDVPFSFANANDAIYFGDDSKFQRLRVNVGTASTNTSTFVWEYYNADASAWAEIPIVTDSTATVAGRPFSVAGWNVVSFQVPADWGTLDPAADPLSAYWIRARVSTYVAGGVKPALSQVQYKPVPFANTYAYVIEGMFNGSDVKVALGNNTALGAADDFTAKVWIKEY